MISHQDTRPLLWIIHPHRPTLSPIRQPRGLVLNNFVGNASHYTTCCQCRPSNATKHGRWEDFTKTHRCTLAVLLSNRRILDQNNHNKLLKTSSTLELALTKIVFPRMNFHLNAHGRKPRGLSWFTSIPCLSLLPGFSVQGILQASILEWVVMLSSKGLSWFRDNPSYIGSLPLVPPGKPQELLTSTILHSCSKWWIQSGQRWDLTLKSGQCVDYKSFILFYFYFILFLNFT